MAGRWAAPGRPGPPARSRSRDVDISPGHRPAFDLHPRPPPSLGQPTLRGTEGAAGVRVCDRCGRLGPDSSRGRRTGPGPGLPPPARPPALARPAAAEPYGQCRRRSPAAAAAPPGAAGGPGLGGLLAKPWRGAGWPAVGRSAGRQEPGYRSAGQAGSCSPALGACPLSRWLRGGRQA